MLKKHISTSIWIAPHPNAGLNIQQTGTQIIHPVNILVTALTNPDNLANDLLILKLLLIVLKVSPPRRSQLMVPDLHGPSNPNWKTHAIQTSK